MKRFITKSMGWMASLFMIVTVLTSAYTFAVKWGLFGFFLGLLLGTMTAVLILGALFLIKDTADNTRRIVKLLEQRNSSRT